MTSFAQPFRRVAIATLVVLAVASIARAQPPPAAPNTSAPSDDTTRPATTTFFGDTGLWYVPTAEILPHGKWSSSAYRRGTNYIQGYTNVGDFAATFAYGVKDRVELFGSFLFDTRIDRDTRPLFSSDRKVGGIVDRYPGVTTTWSGNNVGDLYVGGKVNLLSESREGPMAAALRGIVKVPTGDDQAGVSTGKVDTIVDLIVSREIRRAVELSGFAGYEFRGNPEGFDLSTTAFRWGAGAGFPTRFGVRGFAELSGVLPSNDTAVITSAILTGPDGSHPPLISDTEKLTRLTFGLTYQARNGFFLGGGLSRNMPTETRDLARASEGSFTDYTDWQFRVGFHPGVRARPRRTASIPFTPVTVAATTPDVRPSTPDVRPTAPAPAEPAREVAPRQNAALTPTPQPAVAAYAFEDVYFDFDGSSTLQADARTSLDKAVAAMRGDPALRLTIQGYTCDVGTASYNLALGHRRANVVRNYLVSQGIAADRLTTMSLGEVTAKYDNLREETRRLNRRTSLVRTPAVTVAR